MSELVEWTTNRPAPKTGERVEAFYSGHLPDPQVVVSFDVKFKGWFDDKNHRFPEPTMWRTVNA
ncbi:hypothetical protein [Desulfovibrio sp.]|uniref:hypothetical protein n=1 Tax=Desulfovibrio sp. TaxID=885 RepID=UPI0025BC55D7|nr:hypothetical protein [Desulfovibrio sp.]